MAGGFPPNGPVRLVPQFRVAPDGIEILGIGQDDGVQTGCAVDIQAPLPAPEELVVLLRHLGDEYYDEAGRTLDLIRVEQGQAISPHVEEALLEREPVVPRMRPDVGERGLAVSEARKVRRLPVRA